MVENLKCMYCAELGITNTDVFIEIVDVELGAGWICKECFIESEKEKEEHLKELEKELQAKEQECEELKNIINEAKNSKLDLNSFFAIEATVGEYQLELEQLKAEKQGLIKDWEEKKNLAYEIACKNEKLKAENDNLKSLIWWIHVGAEGADKATTEYYENRNTQYEENYWKRIRALQPPTYESKYKLALTEIKEIAERGFKHSQCNCGAKADLDLILQKISECEGNDEN